MNGSPPKSSAATARDLEENHKPSACSSALLRDVVAVRVVVAVWAGVGVGLGLGCTRPVGTVWESGSPRCGDGVLDPGEECDDGNLVSGDGCDGQCRVDICQPSEEVCNGVDDDCDGLTDEGGVCRCTDPQSLRPGELVTVAGPGDAADPTLAWSGTQYGAVWDRGFALLDGSGTLASSQSGPWFYGSESADITYSAQRGEFVFCWSTGNDISCGVRPEGSEEITTANPLVRPPDGYGYNNPRVVYRSQNDELAIIYQTGGYGGAGFYLLRNGSDWTPRGDPTPASQHPGFNIWDTALTPTAEGYAFVYAGIDEQLYFVEFDEGGQRRGPDTAVAPLPDIEYFSKTLLWDGEYFTAAWSDFRDVHIIRFDDNGEVWAQNKITENPAGTLTYIPILAQGPWIGVVWEELVEGGMEDGVHKVHFTVVDDLGQPLIEPWILTEQGIYPWLASNGESFLASWREGPDIWDPDIAFTHLGCWATVPLNAFQPRRQPGGNLESFALGSPRQRNE